MRNTLLDKKRKYQTAPGYTLFRLSDKPVLPGMVKCIAPGIPDNFLTRNGFEDSTTKRVCFCRCIDGCLRALSKNIEGKILYLDAAFDAYDDEKSGFHTIYSPTEKEVPDAHLTGEVWVPHVILVKTIGVVRAVESIDHDLIYTYGKNHQAKLYDWKYQFSMTLNHTCPDYTEYYACAIRRLYKKKK